MENRVTVLSIIVEAPEMAEQVNALLHEYAPWVRGRMGLPYREKNISVICLVLDAPGRVASALSGKLGMLPGVAAKTITSKH